jgi:hypothetical protein
MLTYQNMPSEKLGKMLLFLILDGLQGGDYFKMLLEEAKRRDSMNIQTTESTNKESDEVVQLSKSLNPLDILEKAKKAEVGEIRTHGGIKVQKQNDGSWKPVKEGKRESSSSTTTGIKEIDDILSIHGESSTTPKISTLTLEKLRKQVERKVERLAESVSNSTNREKLQQYGKALGVIKSALKHHEAKKEESTENSDSNKSTINIANLIGKEYYGTEEEPMDSEAWGYAMNLVKERLKLNKLPSRDEQIKIAEYLRDRHKMHFDDSIKNIVNLNY